METRSSNQTSAPPPPQPDIDIGALLQQLVQLQSRLVDGNLNPTQSSQPKDDKDFTINELPINTSNLKHWSKSVRNSLIAACSDKNKQSMHDYLNLADSCDKYIGSDGDDRDLFNMNLKVIRNDRPDTLTQLDQKLYNKLYKLLTLPNITDIERSILANAESSAAQIFQHDANKSFNLYGVCMLKFIEFELTLPAPERQMSAMHNVFDLLEDTTLHSKQSFSQLITKHKNLFNELSDSGIQTDPDPDFTSAFMRITLIALLDKIEDPEIKLIKNSFLARNRQDRTLQKLYADCQTLVGQTARSTLTSNNPTERKSNNSAAGFVPAGGKKKNDKLPPSACHLCDQTIPEDKRMHWHKDCPAPTAGKGTTRMKRKNEAGKKKGDKGNKRTKTSIASFQQEVKDLKKTLAAAGLTTEKGKKKAEKDSKEQKTNTATAATKDPVQAIKDFISTISVATPDIPADDHPFFTNPLCAVNLALPSTPAPIILDSGAYRDIVPSAEGAITGSIRPSQDGPIRTANGMVDMADEALFNDNLHGEPVWKLIIPDSPVLLSMGTLVKHGYSFIWTTGNYNSPKLVKNKISIPLRIINNVPYIDAKAHRLLCLADNNTSADDVSVEFLNSKKSIDSVKLNKIIKHQIQNYDKLSSLYKTDQHVPAAAMHNTLINEPWTKHLLLHMPADPGCRTCQLAKAKQCPARRRYPQRTRDIDPAHRRFWGEVSVDLVYTNIGDENNCQYFLSAGCYTTGWIECYPIPDKSSSTILRAYQEIQRGKPFPGIIRSDGGKEFTGTFEEHLRTFAIAHVTTPPGDHNANATQERHHHTILQSLRAQLFTAGLPLRLWSRSLQYTCFLLNRTHNSAKTGKTPYEARHGHPYPHEQRLIPFGCEVIPVEPSDIKIDIRGRAHIFLGINHDGSYIHASPEAIDDTFQLNKPLQTSSAGRPKVRPTVFIGKLLKSWQHHRRNQLSYHFRHLCPTCHLELTQFPITCKPCKSGTAGRHQQSPGCRRHRCSCTIAGEHLEGPMPHEHLAPETNNVIAVSKLLSLKDHLQDPLAQEAIANERNAWIRYNAHEYTDPLLLADAQKKYPSGVFSKYRTILSIKNWETSNPIYKARCVNQNLTFDAKGRKMKEVVDVYATPVTHLGINLAIMHGHALPGNTISFEDAKNAYIQSNLLDSNTEEFAILPQEMWPPEWHTKFKSTDTVVARTIKAIYGKPSADRAWNQHLQKHLSADGFQQLKDLEFGLFKKGQGQETTILGTYVDDLPHAGPELLKQQQMSSLKTMIDLKDSNPEDRAIIGSTLFEVYNPDPHKRSYLRSSENYTIHTTSEWKQHIKYPQERLLKKVSTPITKELLEYDDDQTWGEYAGVCRTFVGYLGWLALLRPDISYATAKLRKALHRWTTREDKILARTMQYLDNTRDFATIQTVDSRDFGKYEIHTYTDSDLGGDPETKKSMMSYSTFITGPHGTNVLIAHGCKQESSISTSTPCAELTALHFAITRTGIPLQCIMEEIYGSDITSTVHVDCRPAIQAVNNGYSAELRFMSRTHGISLAFLHDILKQDPAFQIVYVPTELNPADIGTKALPTPIFERHVKTLLMRSISGFKKI